MASEETGTTNPFRLLPSVDEALRRPGVLALEGRVSRELLAGFTADVIESWRVEIKNRALDAAGVEARMTGGVFEASVEMRVRREEGRGIVPVLNATGVVLHTGLGRSPVHPEVAERMARAAGGYCVLEVDRFTGERNQRDDRLSELLGRLTGAEAGIAVNNNAAAVLLTLQTFAAGRESIVSRGELVEIGGSFRVPDVMARADVTLVEVGTTNRTRGADYEKAITPNTGLLMKVHTSNYRVVGFTEEVSPTDLAALGGEHHVPTAFDLGSGLIEIDGAKPLPLGDEPRLLDAVASG
ncbi:MAG: L-seryl-tRNA(Sec) selenium transferase, partial [Candidatus Poribacteria bacterium]